MRCHVRQSSAANALCQNTHPASHPASWGHCRQPGSCCCTTLFLNRHIMFYYKFQSLPLTLLKLPPLCKCCPEPLSGTARLQLLSMQRLKSFFLRQLARSDTHLWRPNAVLKGLYMRQSRLAAAKAVLLAKSGRIIMLEARLCC